MAEFHLHIKSHSRSVGKGAGGHARYVLRQGPYSKRTVDVVEGATVKRVEESRADEVVASESGNMPAWAVDNPVNYWDAADERERANGTVYREVEIALPAELSKEQNISLAKSFVNKIAQSEKGPTPYTLSIHKSEKTPNLLHAHIMLSDRVYDGHDRTPETFFKRAAVKGKAPDMGGAPKCEERRAAPGHDWADRIRPLWADLANAALERAGIEARIDHRTLEARRQEQERLAQEAADRGDHRAALQHGKKSVELDHPPQPKRGRALEHGGPKAAPDRASKVQDWKRRTSERSNLRFDINIETMELARVEREIAAAKSEIERQAQQREAQAQAQREAMAQAHREAQAQKNAQERLETNIQQQALQKQDQWQEQKRKQQAQLEAEAKAQREAEALREREERRQRAEEDQAQKAIREHRHSPDPIPMLSEAMPRKKTRWREWREATLTQRYGEEVAAKAVREDWYIRVRPDLGGLNIVVTDTKGGRREIVDGGDIVRSEGDGIREIPLMLALAQAKGWTTLKLEGNDAFREQAALEAVRMGFALDDRALEQKAREQLEAEAREREAKRVTLAEFGARRGEVLAVSDDRTTLTLYCPKTDETLQVDTGGKRLPDNLQPGHFVDASRNYLSGGLNIKDAPVPKDYQRRVQIQGELPRLDLGLER